MAVRNLEAISRHSEMIKSQKANARKLREDAFWSRVHTIQECQEDAIDAIDTIEHLFKSGMRREYEAWEKQQGIRFSFQYKAFFRGVTLGGTQVSYRPNENNVYFSWNAHGMCEEYNSHSSYDVNRVIDYPREGYDTGLIELAANLRPFLDAFFKWVENL